MKQYDKIRRLKDVIGISLEGLEITEKVDGSNGRFTMEDGEFLWGTRNAESKDCATIFPPYNVIYTRIKSLFVFHSLEVQSKIAAVLHHLVIFGEVAGRMNRHKLDYEWDLDFIVFNAWDKETREYIPFTDLAVQFVAGALNLKFVTILPMTTYAEAVEWTLRQDPRKMEGIVCKDYAHQLMCKFYVPGNEELESAKFGKHKKQPCYGESKFLHRYITRARVEKILMKIMWQRRVQLAMPSGPIMPGPMSFMGHVPAMLKELWHDVLFECIPEFLNEERVYRDIPASKTPEGEDVKTWKEEVLDIGYIRKEMPTLAVVMMKEIAQEANKT